MKRLPGILLLCGCLGLAAAETALPFGAARLENGDISFAGMVVRTTAGELALPCRFVLPEGALEVIVCRPDGRMHETLLCSDVRAVHVQALLYLLGASNGSRLPGEGVQQGDLCDLWLEWQDAQGRQLREPVEEWILDTRTGQNLRPAGWVFVGSTVKDGVFAADAEGNIVINYSVGATVLDSTDPGSVEDTIHIVDAEKSRPPQDAAVTLVIRPRKNHPAGTAAPPPGNESANSDKERVKP
ncbi:MAG: hypothetical protein GX564_03020 [Oligosphaeraceae bacterium]|nr:hypothetical protein [Oligosphaeraceae bacterium]